MKWSRLTPTSPALADAASVRPSTTALLVATVVGSYFLVVVGGVTGATEAASACATWPACHGRWLPVGTGPKAIALAHRLAALLVGVVLVGTLVAAWRREEPTRVRATLALAMLGYPVQTAVGAVTAVRDVPVAVTSLHLVLGMGIVTAPLVALLWHLEDAVGRDADHRSTRDHDTSANATYAGVVGRVRAYLALTKPKLMWLLCLVALAAMGLAAGRSLDPVTAVGTLLGGVLAIGASGTFNHVLEREEDAKMSRTDDRPLVEGVVPVRRAVAFGACLTVASMAAFLAFANPLAAALGLLAVLFYSVVYTLVLKPHTDQNTVVGGAVGAFPALIGWAAVTGHVGLPAVVLGAVVFLWTPAHFYNLALAYREDYERADFPMLPVVRGVGTTRRHILGYLGATLLCASVLGAWPALGLGWLYALTSVALGAGFLWAVVHLYRERTDAAAFRAFLASNVYLGVLLVAVVADTLLV